MYKKNQQSHAILLLIEHQHKERISELFTVLFQYTLLQKWAQLPYPTFENGNVRPSLNYFKKLFNFYKFYLKHMYFTTSKYFYSY